MEHKDKVIIAVISVTAGVIILALLISLIVIGTKSQSCQNSISWFSPEAILWPLGSSLAGTTLGPILISYSPDLTSVWTVNGSSLTTQSVNKANPNTQYWSLVSAGEQSGWYPFQIIQQSNSNNQITSDGNNVTLGSSGNWAQIDNNGCGTLQITTPTVYYVGPDLTVVQQPSTGCTGSVPVYIGVLPTTTLTSA